MGLRAVDIAIRCVVAYELNLDGLAIRNSNRGNSRESIRVNRLAEEPLSS